MLIDASVKHMNIVSDNGLLPLQHQVIIWPNDAILSIRPQGTYFNEISFNIQKFSFKEMQLKMVAAKWEPFCLGLNVLTHWGLVMPYGNMDLDQHWLR